MGGPGEKALRRRRPRGLRRGERRGDGGGVGGVDGQWRHQDAAVGAAAPFAVGEVVAAAAGVSPAEDET